MLVIAAALPCAMLRAQDAVENSGAVSVVAQPAHTTTQYYDPANPDPAMPPLESKEAGVTVSKYSCQAQVGGEVVQQTPQDNRVVAVVRVDQVKITLGLDVAEWVAATAPPKTLAHEDGHRIVSEHFYMHAEIPAQQIGQAIIGKEFSAVGADAQTAANLALNQAATQVAQEYMAQVRDPSEQVQEAYDRITEHGTNTIDELAAIDQALDESAKKIAASAPPGN